MRFVHAGAWRHDAARGPGIADQGYVKETRR